MELPTTNNANPGTANIKICALLLNILASGVVVMNHGRRKKKMEKKERSRDCITQRYMDAARPPAQGLILTEVSKTTTTTTKKPTKKPNSLS